MNSSDFNKLTEACCEEIRETLSQKGQDYSGDLDRLQNFKDASDMTGLTPEACLFGFVVKHIVALQDYIRNVDDPVACPSEAQLVEKTGDIAVYLLPLLRGLLIDRGLMPGYAERIGITNED